MTSSSRALRPVKTEETASHRQDKQMLKSQPRQCEATYVLHQLLFRHLCGQKKKKKVTKTVSEKQLKQRTVHFPMRAQLHLPPLDLAWGHPGCDSVALRTGPPTQLPAAWGHPGCNSVALRTGPPTPASLPPGVILVVTV